MPFGVRACQERLRANHGEVQLQVAGTDDLRESAEARRQRQSLHGASQLLGGRTFVHQRQLQHKL